MANEETSQVIPAIQLHNSGELMPILGLGLYSYPAVPDVVTKTAVLNAIELGYRHFDTASAYFTEQALGEGISEALDRRMIKSRDELFVTSKLWCSDAHPDLVLPALKSSLQKMKLEYLDMYLIHWPVSAKPGPVSPPIKAEDFRPLDFKGVWAAMEACQKLGLAKAIGVSNFSCEKLRQLIAAATIPPAVNQVEVNATWQNKELIEFCKTKEIQVMAYSPLGGPKTGHDRVVRSEVLQEIAKAKGRTTAQVALRWAYEQGITIVAKSFNKERMKQNLDIFNWDLSSDDHQKIGTTPQGRAYTGLDYTSPFGPFRTIEELWDGEV